MWTHLLFCVFLLSREGYYCVLIWGRVLSRTELYSMYVGCFCSTRIGIENEVAEEFILS